MIQFNLLPDIKITFIKARRNKHLVLVTAVIVAGSALAILVLLFLGVSVFQKQHLSNLTKDIKSDAKKLEDTPDLDKVLTIQNQINSLSALHNAKPVTSRLFDYLPKLTPNAVSIQKIDVDFAQSTISITGSADALSTVNKFVDTLKFTTYSVDAQTNTKNAFNKVVLGTFGLNATEKDPKKKASYSINLSFDPNIFDNAKTVALTVPKIISTRSETEKPNPLFDTPSSSNPPGQGQ